MPNLAICRRLTVRQHLMVEEAMQIRRHFLQVQIVLLMAMSATGVVHVLSFSLLRRQIRRLPAASETNRQATNDSCPNGNTSIRISGFSSAARQAFAALLN